MVEPVWTARAEADLQDLFTDLEDHAEGAGEALLQTVGDSLSLITAFPEIAPFYASPFRRILLRHRRLGLFYVVEDRGVVVHAVLDLTQDRETILRHLEA